MEKWIDNKRETDTEQEIKEVQNALKNSFGIGLKKYILISPKMLHIPTWQRNTDMAKATEIAENFNEDKFDPIKAYVTTKGTLEVADGAHRAIAFILKEELKILVEILNCTENEAVFTFLGQQSGRKTMTISDTYRAGVRANIKEYVNFKELFEDYNIQITVEDNELNNPIGKSIVLSNTMLIMNDTSLGEKAEVSISFAGNGVSPGEWNPAMVMRGVSSSCEIGVLANNDAADEGFYISKVTDNDYSSKNNNHVGCWMDGNGNFHASKFHGTATNSDALHGYSASTGADYNTIVRRTENGYIFGSRFNQNSANNENPATSQVMVTNGSDNYLRKTNLSNFKKNLWGLYQRLCKPPN